MARTPAEDHPPLPEPDDSFPSIPMAMADRASSDDFYKMLDDIGDRWRAETDALLGGLA